MAAYSFYRDNKPHLEISKCGYYNWNGEKVNSGPDFMCRYRATITFDFGNVMQEDGHAPHDRDSLRDFAECVASLIRVDNAEFVAKYKALLASSLAANVKKQESIENLYLI